MRPNNRRRDEMPLLEPRLVQEAQRAETEDTIAAEILFRGERRVVQPPPVPLVPGAQQPA